MQGSTLTGNTSWLGALAQRSPRRPLRTDTSISKVYTPIAHFTTTQLTTSRFHIYVQRWADGFDGYHDMCPFNFHDMWCIMCMTWCMDFQGFLMEWWNSPNMIDHWSFILCTYQNYIINHSILWRIRLCILRRANTDHVILLHILEAGLSMYIYGSPPFG